MRVGRTIVLIASAAALSACGGNEAENNVVITNEVPAGADIEALPADESSATSTDELVNGVDEPGGTPPPPPPPAENESNSF